MELCGIFPGNPDVNDVSKNIYEAGGIVGAVCHGPAALSDIKLTNGEFHHPVQLTDLPA